MFQCWVYFIKKKKVESKNTKTATDQLCTITRYPKELPKSCCKGFGYVIVLLQMTTGKMLGNRMGCNVTNIQPV